MEKTQLVIEASERTGTGKGYNRKLRVAGKIPANLIQKGKSTSLELNPKLLSKAWQSEGRKFHLKLESGVKEVTIKELQIHPVKRTAIHVDLMYV